MQQNYSGREKRKFKRVERRFVVTILPKGDSPPWEIVDLENISEGGILFNHNEKIEEGTLLDLKIKIRQDKDAIQCAGRVIHAKKLGDLGLYEYGIGFFDVKPEDLILLRQSLES